MANDRPEWDEDGLTGSGTPISETLLGTISAADALKDLDGIERELAPRGSPRAARPAAG